MAKLRRAAALVEKLDTLRFHEDGSIAGRPAAGQGGGSGREMQGRSKAKGKVQKAKTKGESVSCVHSADVTGGSRWISDG
jgi:hypothetical protein